MLPGADKKLNHQEEQGKSGKILESFGKLSENTGFEFGLLHLFKFIDQTIDPVTGNLRPITSHGHLY